jgi:hypothetical protein
MLWDASTINGYAIEASNAGVGTVSNLFFEDIGWVVRWLVVDTGNWLPGCKVLLPLSAWGDPIGRCFTSPSNRPWNTSRTVRTSTRIIPYHGNRSACL